MKYFYLKNRRALTYYLNRNIPFAQALIKHNIIPKVLIKDIISDGSTIVDLGCGEGILTNFIASCKPDSKVYGIDVQSDKLKMAEKNAPPNAKFIHGDFFKLTEFPECDFLLFNDVVHHIPYERHLELLDKVVKKIKSGGKLILKEVDQNDAFDKILTSFFDTKLYPDDKLSFRSSSEWNSMLRRIGAYDIKELKVSTLWPASRSIIYGTVPNAGKGYQCDISKISSENEKNSEKYYNVLLTGGTGFIGQHLSEKLLKDGLCNKPVRIIFLIRDINKLNEKFKNRSDVIPLLGDLHDLPFLQKALYDVHYVFHLAAEVKFFKGTDVFRNNYDGTLSLIKSLNQKK